MLATELEKAYQDRDGMRIVINTRPIPASRPRVTRNGTYTPAKYANYKKALKMLFKQFDKVKAPIALEINVSLYFVSPKSIKYRKFPMPVGDVDNFLKAILDAGNETLWDDDQQIVKATVSKQYADRDEIIIELNKIVI